MADDGAAQRRVLVVAGAVPLMRICIRVPCRTVVASAMPLRARNAAGTPVYERGKEVPWR